MAWHDQLLDASFRGVPFDAVSTDDASDRAIVEHAYPYQDGVVGEDIGGGASAISVTAVFFGDDYLDRLLALLDALDAGDAGELVHPVFGSRQVMVRSRQVRHDAESPDSATISMSFVEVRTEGAVFARRTAGQKAEAISRPGESALLAAANAVASAVESIRAALPMAELATLRTTMSEPLLSGLAIVSSAVGSGLDVLDEPRAWVGDIGAVVNGILGLQDYADTGLFGWRALGSNFDAIGRRVTGTPSAMQAGRVPTERQAADAAIVFLGVSDVTARADGAALIFAAEAETATLSPPEIEAIAGDCRERLDAVMDDARAVYDLETARAIAEPLKDQALAVQDAARALIETRPPLVRRRVGGYGNLRLLAHRWYADHTRAPELWRLNALRNPNFLTPTDEIDAYAR